MHVTTSLLLSVEDSCTKHKSNYSYQASQSLRWQHAAVEATKLVLHRLLTYRYSQAPTESSAHLQIHARALERKAQM